MSTVLRYGIDKIKQIKPHMIPFFLAFLVVAGWMLPPAYWSTLGIKYENLSINWVIGYWPGLLVVLLAYSDYSEWKTKEATK